MEEACGCPKWMHQDKIWRSTLERMPHALEDNLINWPASNTLGKRGRKCCHLSLVFGVLLQFLGDTQVILHIRSWIKKKKYIYIYIFFSYIFVLGGPNFNLPNWNGKPILKTSRRVTPQSVHGFFPAFLSSIILTRFPAPCILLWGMNTSQLCWQITWM